MQTLKILIITYNQLVNQIYGVDREMGNKEYRLLEIEKEMVRLERERSTLKADMVTDANFRSEVSIAAAHALNAVKTEFAADSRFENSPSEEINRSFSDEVLPDLNELA